MCVSALLNAQKSTKPFILSIKDFEAKTASMTDVQKEKVMQELESSPNCKIVDDLIKIRNKDK